MYPSQRTSILFSVGKFNLTNHQPSVSLTIWKMAVDYFRGYMYLSHAKAKNWFAGIFMIWISKLSSVISQNGIFCSWTKSRLLDTLVQGTNTADEQPKTDTVIIDETALINALSTGAAKPLMIVPHIESYALCPETLRSWYCFILIVRIVRRASPDRKEDHEESIC